MPSVLHASGINGRVGGGGQVNSDSGLRPDCECGYLALLSRAGSILYDFIVMNV
jgi:hypothetical protein